MSSLALAGLSLALLTTRFYHFPQIVYSVLARRKAHTTASTSLAILRSLLSYSCLEIVEPGDIGNTVEAIECFVIKNWNRTCPFLRRYRLPFTASRNVCFADRAAPSQLPSKKANLPSFHRALALNVYLKQRVLEWIGNVEKLLEE